MTSVPNGILCGEVNQSDRNQQDGDQEDSDSVSSEWTDSPSLCHTYSDFEYSHSDEEHSEEPCAEEPDVLTNSEGTFKYFSDESEDGHLDSCVRRNDPEIWGVVGGPAFARKAEVPCVLPLLQLAAMVAGKNFQPGAQKALDYLQAYLLPDILIKQVNHYLTLSSDEYRYYCCVNSFSYNDACVGEHDCNRAKRISALYDQMYPEVRKWVDK